MPRRNRSSGGFRPADPSSRMPNPPALAARAPPPAPLQSGNGPVMGGFGAAVVDGIALGTGSAMAHRAVDAVMGHRVVHHEHVASSVPAAAPAQTSLGVYACGKQSKAFQDCLNHYENDISKCQFYMDMWQECRRSSAPASTA